MIRSLLQSILRCLAIRVLRRYHPKVVGITGSVGKTSTKEAVAAVLKAKFRIRSNIKNYNNEIGVPLTIIGCESGKKNIFSWLGIFIHALNLIWRHDPAYPEVLVIEMAADKPGDIKYLTDFVPCDVGIVTAIAPVHLEFFSTIENIITEKSTIVSHLSPDGWAILNADEEWSEGVALKTKAKLLTFGFSSQAQVQAQELSVSFARAPTEESALGLHYKFSYRGNVVPVFLPQALGPYQAYATLAAASCGIAFEINLHEISQALETYRAPAGRMKLIPGIKNTYLIDDTYNSSPVAAKKALEVLKEFPVSGRKWAVLGDMAELGPYTEQGHYDVGEVAAHTADYLITVGEAAKMIAEAAIKAGMSEDRVYKFDASVPAGKFLQEKIEAGDIILAKGSQVVRMEKIIKELMAEPERARSLLVRQDKSWQK